MQGLKALVIFMGVLIVIGMGVLAYGLATKFDKDATKETPRVAEVPVAAAPIVNNPHKSWIPQAPFGDVDAFLPVGAEIMEFIPNKRRLLIIYKAANGARAIKVINVANGNDMGTIHLDETVAAGSAN